MIEFYTLLLYYTFKVISKLFFFNFLLTVSNSLYFQYKLIFGKFLNTHISSFKYKMSASQNARRYVCEICVGIGTSRYSKFFRVLLAPVCYSAYHGHLTSMIDVSPYKLNLPGGPEKPEWVHVVSQSCIRCAAYVVAPLFRHPSWQILVSTKKTKVRLFNIHLSQLGK